MGRQSPLCGSLLPGGLCSLEENMGVYVYKWGIEKDFEKIENSLPIKNIDKFDYITIKKCV